MNPRPANPLRTQWEDHAEWWIEGFTNGADPEYEEQVLPLAAAELSGARTILDIGCGDGQVSRMMAATGATVVGVDPTWNQIRVAHERGGAAHYTRSTADELPFADAAFDATIVCLVFEHVDALDESIAEVARVTRPGGRFCFFLNHPLLQTPGSGWIDDHFTDPPEQYWRLGPYLHETEYVDQIDHGVHVRYLHRPLSRYINALADHGLVLEHMVEPAPPPGYLQSIPAFPDEPAMPRLLYLRLRRV